ncbi:unnamed protein product [Darwinula stevensoni]|uniref:receptor protein-tyrosine kinase n=1 Tax=Darwinula stevensoni TaxID=69355 RepID=A0A7R8X4G0_9CRUS|nr:unnamed protein product [Darwinula stevensoni]CAG0885972.1 unnamed protein product [Darwinula stevensoni]
MQKGRIPPKKASNGQHIIGLEIRNATSMDEGKYYCRATISNVTKESYHRVIVRNGHVEISPVETTAHAHKGKRTVSWVLKVEAEPNPNIILKHNGLEVPNNSKYCIQRNLEQKTITVSIHNITDEDDGIYEVIIQLGLQTQTISLKLIVESTIQYSVPDGHVEITPVETTAHAHKGKRTVSWVLKVEADPNPNIILKHNGLEVPNNSKYCIERNLEQKTIIVSIHNITDEDDGIYKVIIQLGLQTQTIALKLIVENKEIGRGEFGHVVRAVAIGIRPPERETTVAVKKRKPGCNNLENYLALMMELKIMSHLGNHMNVVNLLGACTKNMARDKEIGRGEFGHVVRAVAIGIRPPERETTVAVKKRKPGCNNLENYLALMMELKIMSHLGNHMNVVPIAYRWMAPECLTYDGMYTSQSDVWAFGVTLWEIFTLGMTPYQGMKVHELVQNLQKGYRLECPVYANHRM